MAFCRNQVLLKSYEIPEFRNNLACFFLLIILKSEKDFNFITIGKYALSKNGAPGGWPPSGRI
jgi:hypothetical protein